MRSARTLRPQRGSSLVEFLLVSAPILLLCLTSIELAHWYHVRQIVGLALLQAARAGATQHGQPSVMAHAFEQGLRPLFLGASAPQTDARLHQRMQQRQHALHPGPPWQIRILKPDADAFAQFSSPTLAIARSSGLPTIRNDYQYEQHQQQHANAASNIFTANTLVLRLVYPHTPLLPGLGRLLASFSTHPDAYAQQALAAGLLPMVREVSLEMASHPVRWPSLPDGRVIHSTGDNARPQPTTIATLCRGLWCQAQARAPSLPASTEPHLPEAVQPPDFPTTDTRVPEESHTPDAPPDEAPLCL